jgi:hypothetical protein
MASGGATSVLRYRQLLSSNSLTTTYDEVVAAASNVNDSNLLHYGNSSAESVVVGIGEAGDETEIALLPPLSHGMIPCIVPKGVRIAIKSAATMAVGLVSLDFRK